jgi:SpoVK/Ycf46/Vps4 family AAA+-type ATPase
MRPI